MHLDVLSTVCMTSGPKMNPCGTPLWNTSECCSDIPVKRYNNMHKQQATCVSVGMGQCTCVEIYILGMFLRRLYTFASHNSRPICALIEHEQVFACVSSMRNNFKNCTQGCLGTVKKYKRGILLSQSVSQ